VALEGGPGGPGEWSVYLVDLPGYGYARGGADSAAELAQVAESYFGDSGARNFSSAPDGPRVSSDAQLKLRAPLSAALLLIDSRHPRLQADADAARWLATLGVEYRIVATKIDKLTRSERVKNLKELETTFSAAALPVSAASGEGMDELWRTIARLVRAAA
jgi:GTP-binding protein